MVAVRGKDVELLTAEGVACSGWDPAYRPDTPLAETNVVNLGYVINVIEDPEETRRHTTKGMEPVPRAPGRFRTSEDVRPG